MKKILLLLFSIIVLSLALLGCGGKAAVKDKPSDEELAKTSRIYGVVREIDSVLIYYEGILMLEVSDDETNECFIINKESELLNELVTHLDGEEFEMSEEKIYGATTDGAENEEFEVIGKGPAGYLAGCATTGYFLEAEI